MDKRTMQTITAACPHIVAGQLVTVKIGTDSADVMDGSRYRLQ